MDKNKHLKRSIWLFGAILMISIILLGCEGVTPTPPASITLEPKEAINSVCIFHIATATVKDKDGNPVPGVKVSFTVKGANSASGSDTTDDFGEAIFSYHGKNVGKDTITAEVGGLQDNATKTWVAAPASITLYPKEAINPVGTLHTVTATVKDKDGNPVPGVKVSFTVKGANPAIDSDTTDDFGEAIFFYHGENVGKDTITAEVGGLQDNATKTWVAGPPASITLYPEEAINPVCIDHIVTATVKDDGGNPVPGAVVFFWVSGANSASGSKVTDVNGQATFSYHGENEGMDYISANFGDVEDYATKTWVAEPAGPPENIYLEPEESTNVVCTWHTVRATVKDKDGKPVPGVEVIFTVRGVNSASGSKITDGFGEATFSYHGEYVGPDTITAEVNDREVIAYKYWVHEWQE